MNVRSDRSDVKNKLDIHVGFKEGRSYLKDTFFTPPFRVADLSIDRSDPVCYLMIQSSSPGILDNDHNDITVRASSGSHLQMSSQSYQRLFNMRTGAQQDMRIDLEKGTRMSFIQHPIVPHENSSFSARNAIHMADDAVFTYGEIVTCGRKLSGERFRFTRFQNLTTVFHNGRLILKDNILLEPRTLDIHSIGMLEGYTHQGTLIHVHTGAAPIDDLVASARSVMEAEEDITFGLSQPAPEIMVLRVLGNGGEQLLEAFRAIDRAVWTEQGATQEREVPVEPIIQEA
ncbi:MAG: urease accessory protein UreD [Flavobacteriales bacterium]|nr:urease accessory protein UreD [Flavobacteriales bacterium]